MVVRVAMTLQLSAFTALLKGVSIIWVEPI
jgi:hypothetical protein